MTLTSTRGKQICLWVGKRASVLPSPPCGEFCPGECGYDPNNPDDPCATPPEVSAS